MPWPAGCPSSPRIPKAMWCGITGASLRNATATGWESSTCGTAPGEQVHGRLPGPPGHIALQGQGGALRQDHLQDHHYRRDGRAELRAKPVLLRRRRGPAHVHHPAGGGVLSPDPAAHRVRVQDHPGADGSQSG